MNIYLIRFLVLFLILAAIWEGGNPQDCLLTILDEIIASRSFLFGKNQNCRPSFLKIGTASQTTNYNPMNIYYLIRPFGALKLLFIFALEIIKIAVPVFKENWDDIPNSKL